MKTGPWQVAAAALVVTAWFTLSGTASAQGPLAPPAIGVDLPRSGGECAGQQERALLGPQGCAQGPATLPTWIGSVPYPGSSAGASLAQERARDVSDWLRSPEHLGRLEAEKTRLQREMLGQVLEAVPEASGSGRSPSGRLPPTDRIYLFISESIPSETLRNYARDIADLGDPGIVMVLRGFVGGMKHVLPTRRFVLDVLRKDIACDPEDQSECDLYPVNLVIDPLLFRRYDVREVPTVVYAKVDQRDRPQDNKGRQRVASLDRFWRIQGDTGLDSLVRRINEDAKSDALSALLDLRKGGVRGW